MLRMKHGSSRVVFRRWRLPCGTEKIKNEMARKPSLSGFNCLSIRSSCEQRSMRDGGHAMRCSAMLRNDRALLSMGRAFFICACVFAWSTGVLAAGSGANSRSQNGQMTAEEAKRLGEEFGIVVDEVDEEIRGILKMVRAEGVAV